MDRLLALNLLPLAFDREIKDLTFMFKTLHGFYDLDAFDFVSFVNHSRTRNCNNPSLVLKVPSCKSSTFQTSFFNRIVHSGIILAKLLLLEIFAVWQRLNPSYQEHTSIY
jgi:hypothetical protein